MKALKKSKSKELSRSSDSGEGDGGRSSSRSAISRKHNDYITCKIRLLDDAQVPFEFSVKKSDLGNKLFLLVCEKLGDILERDYFGLRYTDKHSQRQWLDLEKSVYKQLKDCKSYGLSFRIKHYPSDPIHNLKQNLSRYLLYLQIRRDLAQGRLLVPPAMIGAIGALVVQAELGDAPENCDAISDHENSLFDKLPKDGKDSDSGSAALSGTHFDQVPSDTSKESPHCCDYFRKLKIVFNQTPEIEEEIWKEHQKLRGLKIQEAESELLLRASQLPTYGIDPFPATPMHKIYLPGPTLNSDAKSQIQNTLQLLPKDIPFYLGITDTGIVTFAGRQKNQEYHWDQIQRLGCDGKLFLIYLRKDRDKRFVRVKITLLSFKCKSKAAALAFWHWAVDRKCFFTLKQASEAKKLRSSTSLFHRSHTYRFSGRSQQELCETTTALDHVPQPQFTRVASLRRVIGSYMDPNSSSSSLYRVTLPCRIKPVYEYGEGQDSKKILPEETSHTTSLTSVEVEKSMVVTDRIPDTVNEKLTEETQIAGAGITPAIQTETNMELIQDTKNLLLKANAPPLSVPEEIVEAVHIPKVHDATSKEQDVAQTDFNDKDFGLSGLDRKKLIESTEYNLIVNDLDKTIEHHQALAENNVNDAKSMATLKTPEITEPPNIYQNGPVPVKPEPIVHKDTPKSSMLISKTGKDLAHSNNVSGISSAIKPDKSNNSTLTYTLAVIMVIVGVIVILETTPPASQNSRNLLYRTALANPVITTLDSYIYHPVRDRIVNGFAYFWSYLNDIHN